MRHCKPHKMAYFDTNIFIVTLLCLIIKNKKREKFFSIKNLYFILRGKIIMTAQYKEIAFESTIEQYLLKKGGYLKGDPSTFNQSKGFDPSVLIAFLKETQVSAMGLYSKSSKRSNRRHYY